MEKLDLNDPVGCIPLIGAAQARKLKNLEISSVEDLLHHYPFRYEDFSSVKKISELVAGEPATICGELLAIENITTRMGKKLTKGVAADETGKLLLIWFNQPYLVKNLKVGERVSLAGKLSIFDGRPAFVSPEYEVAKDQAPDTRYQAPITRHQTPDTRHQTIHTARLVPIYPETAGLSSKWLRSRINAAITNYQLPITKSEFLPEELRKKYSLISLPKALNQIHFPKNQEESRQARKRLAFDEIFLIQIKAALRKRDWKKRKAAAVLPVGKFQEELQNFERSLPFKLTLAQKRCLSEILTDLARKAPMNRLLQGDVGSGKTIVAVFAALATHLAGFSTLYMAPTEILASQHYQTFKEYLNPLGVGIGLLTGSKKLPITNNQSPITILVGTHALLYDKNPLPNVALVIIDEQHRFGVEQRAKLLKKVTTNQTTKQPNHQTTKPPNNHLPHLLTMTATPIPRTLSLTIYGDLDLSLLDEMPKGRKKVKTWVVPPHKRAAAYEWIRKQIKDFHPEGERGTEPQRSQAFIICPLIEESDYETLKSIRAATEEFKKLKEKVFPDLKLGLLHGRMKTKEKEKIVNEFRKEKLNILVSTPVVEVGVDIPQATIMLIEGSERFGLASLHQMRGRVGRSDKDSYCLLFSDLPGGENIRRLKALEKYHNGQALAEIDLKIRGRGDFFGTKQHGFPKLKIASLDNFALMKNTREEARKLLEDSPALDKYPPLKGKLERIITAAVEPN